MEKFKVFRIDRPLVPIWNCNRRGYKLGEMSENSEAAIRIKMTVLKVLKNFRKKTSGWVLF